MGTIAYTMKKTISTFLMFAIILSFFAFSTHASDLNSDPMGLRLYSSYLSKQNYSDTVTVAVIDSGVSQIDCLKEKLICGYDFYDDDNDATNDISDDSHGTAIASIIADLTKDLPIKIMPVRILENKNVVIDDLVEGIIYAVDNGADIINLSLGGTLYDCSEIDNAVEYACSNDVTVVVAAGNSKKEISDYCPAHNEDAITISAVDEQGYFADQFSNFGEFIDCCAPGVQINAYNAQGFPIQISGTSFSAAFISAGAAMIKLEHPEYTNLRIQQTIKSICEDFGEEGFDYFYGYGLPRFDWLMTPSVTINNKADAVTINYGEILRMTAETSGVRDNCKINWYIDGVKVGEGKIFELNSKNKAVNITVKVVDENEQPLKDEFGDEISDSQMVYIKTGILQRIISIIKNILNVNRVVIL